MILAAGVNRASQLSRSAYEYIEKSKPAQSSPVPIIDSSLLAH
jgi:hypothetical protein